MLLRLVSHFAPRELPMSRNDYLRPPDSTFIVVRWCVRAFPSFRGADWVSEYCSVATLRQETMRRTNWLRERQKIWTFLYAT